MLFEKGAPLRPGATQVAQRQKRGLAGHPGAPFGRLADVHQHGGTGFHRGLGGDEVDAGAGANKHPDDEGGGNQQSGALIVEGKVDFLIFFWDPLEPQPHDPDVKALLRMAVVWNVPVACDRSTADFIISSPLMHGEDERLVPDYEAYARRKLPVEVKPAIRAPKPKE